MKTWITVVALLLTLTVVTDVHARSWYILPDGSGDAPTIQAGLDSCATGDTVLVACGTYYEYGLSMLPSRNLLGETGDPDCVTIDGGGIARILTFSGPGSDRFIEGITFTGGASSSQGGAIVLSGNAAQIRKCRFLNNQAANHGGAIYVPNTFTGQIVECVFENNTALGSGYGGALYMANYSTPQITGCAFVGNTANYRGGAVTLYNNSGATFTNCVFCGNTANANYGGAVYMYRNSNPTFTNCTIAGNTADYGSAMFLYDYAAPVLDRTIIAFNGSGSAAGYSGSGINPSLSCCNVYGNTGGDYTSCFSGWNGYNNNHSEDPLFCDLANGDLHLDYDSPSQNVTGCGLVGALGVGCGWPRLWYVAQDGSGDMTTIGAALNAAGPLDTILVAPGTYYEYNLLVEDGEKLWSEAGPEETVIDAQGLGRVMIIGGDSTTELDGFTLTGGNTEFGLGGGLYVTSGEPILSCCIVSSNYGYAGGGIMCEGASPVIDRFVIADNSALYGGGMYVYNYAAPTLTNCTLSHNGAAYSGGGVALNINAAPVFENSIIAFSTEGAAVVCTEGSSTPTFSCCDLYGNAGGDWAGCIAGMDSTDGNFSADPLFCSPEDLNYDLQPGSPCGPGESPAGCGLVGAGIQSAPPVAEFLPGYHAACGSTYVCFTNLSRPDSVVNCLWYFGDGDSSAEFEPCHAYADPGFYDITLITFACGRDTAYGQVVVGDIEPTAAFSATVTKGVFGCAPFEVRFQDHSEGVIADRYWHFGDGTIDSTTLNPCHTYAYGDTFDVTLITANPCGTDTLIKTNHVLVFDPPSACISIPVDSVLVDSVICFQDCSTGLVTELYWDFGDGTDTTHTTQVCHAYVDSGTVTIQLIASSPFCGSDTTAVALVVYIPPVTGADSNQGRLPGRLVLGDNYPNPFNPTTTIEYALPAPGGHVELSVYDVHGRRVRTLIDDDAIGGRYQVFWDGRNDHGQRLSSGVYFYRLSTPHGVEQRKAILLK
jgi:predicted outer membrane repeat protein/parallel beta-helix repeat protein